MLTSTLNIETTTINSTTNIDPLHLYQHLCDRKDTALLETYEAGSDLHRQSFIFSKAALKITADQNQKGVRSIKVEALTAFGGTLFEILEAQLSGFELIEKNEKQLIFECIEQTQVQSENERLNQSSSLTGLNSVRQALADRLHNKNHREKLAFFGLISFDMIDQFEALPSVTKEQPDYIFYLAEQYLICRQGKTCIEIVELGEPSSMSESFAKQVKELCKKPRHSLVSPVCSESALNAASKIAVDVHDDEFERRVKVAKDHIAQGDIFQVVLSRCFKLACFKPLAAYQALRLSDPSPYMYFLNFGKESGGGFQLFGSSPESALRVSNDREVALYPIAGTKPRGLDDSGEVDHDLDARIEFALTTDTKENAEHMMLVDLARNDLARVVQAGTRRVVKLKQVVRYSRVMHLVSEVVGRLCPTLNSLTAYRACANPGTLSGAPKIEAQRLIRDIEGKARGFYGGSVCVYLGDDTFDSAIIIRSALVKNGVAHVQAGAGVVHDSDPKAEADETLHKASAVLAAIAESNKREAA